MKWVRKVLLYFETRVAPWMATYFCWIYWPLAFICKRSNICFVINIAGGTGHIISELDQFFRKLKIGHVDLSKKYIWIRKNDVFSKTCLKLYGDQFYFSKGSYLLYLFLLPFTIRYRQFTYDAGLSRLKWQFLGKQSKRQSLDQSYLDQVSKKTGIEYWSSYYQIRAQTRSHFPLVTDRLKWDLDDLLGPIEQKRVLIHLKEKAENATALPTDPLTYLPFISYCKNQGHQMVFVGREKMPPCFASYGVIDYASSLKASFQRDILLFQSAYLCVLSGSGISFLADCFNIPYLYINSWHLPLVMFSSASVHVPTLVQKKEGAFLSFQEQIALYLEMPDKGAERFPETKGIPKNASGEDIYQAVLELEQLIQNWTPASTLQEQFRCLRTDIPLRWSESRISHHFIQKYQFLLST